VITELTVAHRNEKRAQIAFLCSSAYVPAKIRYHYSEEKHLFHELEHHKIQAKHFLNFIYSSVRGLFYAVDVCYQENPGITLTVHPNLFQTLSRLGRASGVK
jgi:hypothetical protein